MKKVLIEKYKCDYCDMLFDDEEKASKHEKKAHMCPNCIHSWLLYGSEISCDLNKCNFEKKTEK